MLAVVEDLLLAWLLRGQRVERRFVMVEDFRHHFFEPRWTARSAIRYFLVIVGHVEARNLFLKARFTMPTPEDPMSILECIRRSPYPLTFRYLVKATGLNVKELNRRLSRLVRAGLVLQVTYAESLGFGEIRYSLRKSSEAIESASLEEKPSNQLIEDDAPTSSMRFGTNRRKLSSEEESYLIRRVQEEDDKKSEASLVSNFRPWLSGMAHSICIEQDKIDDLVQVGTERFLKCIRQFDRERGSTISAYAYRAVRGAMLNSLVREDRLIPVPEPMRLTIRLIREATDRLQLQHGREPSIKEIAEETELTEDTVRSATQADSFRFISCYESLPEEDFAAHESLQPEHIVERRHLMESLLHAVSHSTYLTDKQRKILYFRYVVPLSERKTLDELGADLKISASQVHRIEQKAIDKLKEELNAEE